MKILVTGGAGFIGSALIKHIIKYTNHKVLNLDALKYSSSLESLKKISSSKRYFFKKIDISNLKKIEKCIFKFKPDKIIHLAAESHVDRSIEGPTAFIQTNIIGTFNLLQVAKKYFNSLKKKKNFVFHHVSTDEVFGDLVEQNKKYFDENSNYQPNSPYSASKASSDHLVRAWHKTYGTPIVITNCSNNYGPYQYPEKLIPHTILNAIHGKDIPIYGNGKQVRDWLYVEDHVVALLKVLNKGKIGETYNIGGNSKKTNIKVVLEICKILNKIFIKKYKKDFNFKTLIKFVQDRPGHDAMYAINCRKIKNKLGWKPRFSFKEGLKKTVEWYVFNAVWWKKIIKKNYKLNRIGLAK